MDATIEKLKRINQEIQNRDVFDQYLKNLIAIDLYSFIKGKPVLNSIFNERVGFLQGLSNDKDFKKLQKKLIDLSSQIIEVIPTNEISNSSFVSFGDRNSFYCYYDFDSTLKHDSNPIIKQYSAALNTFDNTVRKNKLEGSDQSRFKKYISLRDEFQKNLTELRRNLCKTGNELHVRQFEDFLGICFVMWRHPEDSSFTEFQNEYRTFTWNVMREVRDSLKNVKEICNVVIIDLIENIKINQEQKTNENFFEDIYKITVKDREIWINNYLLSKPHATGNNFDFFEFIIRQPKQTKIQLDSIQNQEHRKAMTKAIGGRRFVKILNALGFKGEIKKAFFNKVGADSLCFQGQKVSKDDLDKNGVKMTVFIKELEVAHAKNCPE
ncbi:hypothetical protein A3I41_05480 [Candidatus Uhrbacteria bacterium RIFCSPLOWO2_02_FULL_48_18]|uniref:Uncharacterized protein n=1 Tax=Candidatus Uhrbacteria bacterium RIFCSPLOWO2_02_FULL_48_18 TaxID=1802408 RepID=A0A1F7V9H3_9BACT|nr:MAG: hypothetical protein A3B20_00710 [Candidatus Uhrbacteria bacterium RIFCSPLOWO2_01_FULL_47_17]OGL86748.1 MAG: hypothetical protein A3I41_05480 [Candidatus Uhrbacteria bacterium RIFCSPLOWO2_02_FULL_48_18]